MLKLYIFPLLTCHLFSTIKYTQNQYWIAYKYGPFIKFYSILIEIMIMT